jgi:hypothetical protein
MDAPYLLPEVSRFNLVGQSNNQNASLHKAEFYDCETRRPVYVRLQIGPGVVYPNADAEFEAHGEKAMAALTEHLDNLPLETGEIEVDETGGLLSFSTDPAKSAPGRRTNYPLLEQFQLPRAVAVKTVLRSELIETRRFIIGADMVSYSPLPTTTPTRPDKGRYVFKYSVSTFVSRWKEIQISARLPRHPNMVLLDRLVLDETTKSHVVGFTMRYIPNGTLVERRPFKLKWLQQLMQAVDDLNLKHGIIHQDIADRNLMIDPETDAIVMIDFDNAYRVGIARGLDKNSEGEWPGRDDVKGVLVFLYEYITRDPVLESYALHLCNEKDFWDPAKWIKHPDVDLDNDVAEFYFELMAWVRRRRASKQLAHHTEAPQHLEWPEWCPNKRPGPNVGLPYLEWRRPCPSKVDPDRRLLATGRYADEEAAGQIAAEGRAEAAAAATAAAATMRKARDGELAPIIPFVFSLGQEIVGIPARRVLRPRPKRKDTDGDAGQVDAVKNSEKPGKRKRTAKRSGRARA